MHEELVLKGPKTDRISTYHVFKIDHVCEQNWLTDDTEVNRNVWESGILFQRPIKSAFPLVSAGALSVSIDRSLRAGALISRRPVLKYGFMSILPIQLYCLQQLLLNISVVKYHTFRLTHLTGGKKKAWFLILSQLLLLCQRTHIELLHWQHFEGIGPP